MALFGTSLAVAGTFSSGTPDQLAEWVPGERGHRAAVSAGARAPEG
jgi:hypothetical protein